MVALVALYGEPLEGLGGEDLAGVASTLHRAHSTELARSVADEAVARGGGAAALRARALLSKALGERDRALADFESLLVEVDDGSVRLELAKLYEHYLRAPAAALRMVEKGTGETPSSRRKAPDAATAQAGASPCPPAQEKGWG